MWEFGSVRNPSSGSEITIGDDDVDGVVNASEDSSLSLALAMKKLRDFGFWEFLGAQSGSSGMGSGEWCGMDGLVDFGHRMGNYDTCFYGY